MTVAEHLVGRADELDSFDHLLAALDAGRAAMAVEVVGEPGIGKTRLLTELAGRADARGHLVLSGSASELERDLPFGLFVDALDDYLQGLERDRLVGLDDDIRNGLASVFPSLHPLATSQGEALSHERYRGHRAVREILERLTGVRPLVLLLDDIHWSDSASIDLLGSLLRRPPDAAVLLVLALRPRQVPERLAAALEPARRADSLARLELGALTRERSRRATRVERRRDDGGHSVRGQRRKPVLPRAARESGQSRNVEQDRHVAELAWRPGGATPGSRGAGGGARPAAGRVASSVTRCRRRWRSLRP